MSFELLNQRVVDVLKGMNIFAPTDPQTAAIPKILDGKNVLLVAPTGIGKTEAVMLPIFDMLLRAPSKGIRCVYVTPLRALNRDMLRRMDEFGKALGLKVGVRHGDTPDHERMKQSRDPPDILITTPETLQVLFTGKRLREHLKSVKWLVVDEIHELATVERGAQLSVAMERLVMLSGEYQRIGSSATVGNVGEVAKFLSGTGRDVVISKHDTKRDLVLDVECPDAGKNNPVLMDKLQSDPNVLAVIERAKEHIENGRSTLFFVNTRETAEWLAARYHLYDEGFSIDVHHGSLSKENRMEMEDRFKKGELRALICTSSLELGIDVGSTDLVIQYNSPRQVSRMIQRAGRAGHRIGETIRAKILATAPDELLEAAVIARRTGAKELEDKTGRPKPFTVLANQLIAMTMSSRMNRDDAFSVFKRSHAFRDLERIEMDAVLEQLMSIRMIFEDANGFRRSKKGMDYFYNNISMIPDERTYLIRDIGTRGIIGTLDESFVATFAEPYAMFITKGRTWRIVEMYEDEILVEGSKEIGSVPSWTGNDIPVPYEVAEEVGRLRRIGNIDDYDCDDDAKERIRSYIDGQKKKFEVPSDVLVTLEVGDRLAIINSCFGTRVNETLSKIYSALLSARLGESIGISTDPYRIIIELPRNIGKDVLLNALTSIRPGSVESLTRMTMANSSYLKWRFVYVAKKFGIIDKDADHRYINFSRLFDTYRDTPVYDDAVRKVLWEDLDIENSERAIAALSDGTVRIKVTGISPIGMEGVVRTKELMQPLRADHSILVAMKKRLEDEVVHASCIRCQGQWRVRVRDSPKRFVCGKCGGNMIAVLKEYEKENIKLFSKKG
ncbi:MAG: DEAD/DEAH box helicase, partial [Methanomassiliicoccaceae archaeon]|nr:DEAD/DEAH box helicase [Methanomassiliicoccaceae archaeon]